MLGITMMLSYLDFERSEDTLGTVTFDALASVQGPLREAVRADIDAVLAWAQATFPGQQGPLAEGAVWDFDRSEQDDGDGWVSLTLTMSGDAHFAQAFVQAFGVD